MHFMVIHCDQDFTNKFEDHVNSFFDAMQRTNDKRIKNFLIQRMKNEIKSGFDPALRDIKSRYVSLEDALIKIVKALKWNILKDGKYYTI